MSQTVGAVEAVVPTGELLKPTFCMSELGYPKVKHKWCFYKLA